MFIMQVELSMTGNFAFEGTDKKRFVYRTNMMQDHTHFFFNVIDKYKQRDSDQYYGFLKVCNIIIHYRLYPLCLQQTGLHYCTALLFSSVHFIMWSYMCMSVLYLNVLV